VVDPESFREAEKKVVELWEKFCGFILGKVEEIFGKIEENLGNSEGIRLKLLRDLKLQARR
jgi:hypothetical protein